MKCLARIALCFLLSFAFACAPAVVGTSEDSSVQSEEVSATPAPTAAPAPEPLGMAPVDLLGKGYNLFLDQTFPAGYSIYGACFDSADSRKGTGDRYALFLTAEGDRTEIVRYCAELLGVTDEATLTGYADAMTSDGFTDITGTYAGKTAYAGLKHSEAGNQFDQATDVDGCRIEIAIDVTGEQAEQYRTLVLANYSTAMLGGLADRLSDDTIRKDLLYMFTNVQKPKKTVVYVVHTMDDPLAFSTEIAEKLETSWHDDETGSVSIQYGPQRADYNFDPEQKRVTAVLFLNDNSTPAGEFKLSDVSLTKLGFQYKEEDKLCLLEDKQNGYMIAVSKPEWNRTEEDWNLMFYRDDIYMTYREDSNLFTVMATCNDVQAGCDYDCAKNAFGEGWPSEETLQENFSGVLGGAQTEDVRAGVFAIFTDLVQDRFGMTWQELYALPVC